jgi:uncharacterized protein (UPF0335 family)
MSDLEAHFYTGCGQWQGANCRAAPCGLNRVQAKHLAGAASNQIKTKGKHMQKVTTGGVEAPKLRSYIERVERLEEDKSGIASDIKDVMAEAKSNGFDVKAMRQILKLRKMKANERTEAEYMLDLYKRALGMEVELEEAA